MCEEDKGKLSSNKGKKKQLTISDKTGILEKVILLIHHWGR
ncbi:MAG: hypothetical protein ACRCTQ_05625 [Brevinemataceae bacterium]